MTDHQSVSSLPTRYRPSVWEDVAGHENAVSRLKGMLKKKTIPNAILFQGQTGTGKTTLARMFARYLNCETNTACGTCKSCKAFASRHPDILEINFAETRGIDDIRALVQHIKYKPQVGRFRVIIGDELQGLATNKTAQAAFLKPLEEPPSHTIFLLASMEAHKIDPAILGRCQVLTLNPVSRTDVAARLLTIAEQEGMTFVTEDLALQIADATGGLLRTAVQALEAVSQVVSGQEKKLKPEALQAIVQDQLVDTLGMADDVSAIRALLCIYKGSVKSLIKGLISITDFTGMLMKMLYLNDYLIKVAVDPSNKQVWHTPSNRKFAETFAEKVGSLDEWLPGMVAVQDALVNARNDIVQSTPDKLLVPARLTKLAVKMGNAK